MVVPVEARRWEKEANPFFHRHREVISMSGVSPAKRLIPSCQEKPLSEFSEVTVPQTDTGGRGENPKARERTLVKELGKMTP